MQINITNEDITTLEVDAIVNAANRELSSGGGVCGAIHEKAGPELEKACARLSRRMGGVLPGEAVITKGYELPARHVIHTLGPVWRGQSPELHDELREELAACYTNSLDVAEEHKLTSVAFPSIGTGAFGWDKKVAAQIALPVVAKHKPYHLQRVIMCCYGEAKQEMDVMRGILRTTNGEAVEYRKPRSPKPLGCDQVARMMCGKPDYEKVRFLRHTLLDFCKYIHRRGYRFDKLSDAPGEFFAHDKRGAQSGSNLIKSLLSIVNAEELVESQIRKN